MDRLSLMSWLSVVGAFVFLMTGFGLDIPLLQGAGFALLLSNLAFQWAVQTANKL